MNNTVQITAGIEYDTRSLRAVKLTPVKGKSEFSWEMEQCELRGDYTKEQELVDAIKQVTHTLGIKRGAVVASALWGKQAFVTELQQKRGTLQELTTAVQFELRKSIPFDVTTAILEFHEIGIAESGSEMITLAVGAITPQLFKQHIRTLELADIKPELIDLLPFTICNCALDLCSSDEESGASAILHVGSEVSTLIITDVAVPGSFYHRSIYFSADEIFVKSELSEEEVSRRLMSLVEEINRTIQFYRKNYLGNLKSNLTICGVHTDQELLVTTLGHTELDVQRVTVANSIQTDIPETAQGSFVVASALALRLAEGGVHG